MVTNYLARENKRNADHRKLYTDMLRVIGEGEVLIAHHLVYVDKDKGTGEPEEIPSADTLIFCHDAMSRIFPEDWQDVLARLAQAHPDQRDALLHDLFYGKYPALEVVG